MDDPTHVRLVDAHTEGYGGAHDRDLVVLEGILHPRAIGVAHAGMVAVGPDAAQLEFGGHVFGVLAAEAIDDPRLIGPLPDKIDDLLDPLLPRAHFEVQIGPVERGDENGRVVELQLLDDVAAGGPVGRGRQRDDRYAGKFLFEKLQLRVLGPEIMPPGRNAMRLVDGDQVDRTVAHEADKIGRHQFFRRNVHQIDPSVEQIVFDLSLLPTVDGAVQKGGPDAVGPQGFHLVFHQGDQRRNHHATALHQNGRQLVANRLAAARRHQHQRVFLVENGLDDVGLHRPEKVKTEDLLHGPLGLLNSHTTQNFAVLARSVG